MPRSSEAMAAEYARALPWRCQVDVDPALAEQIHLDNLQVSELFYRARLLFHDTLLDGLGSAATPASIVARVATDFHAELLFQPAIEIAGGVARIGKTSWMLRLVAFAGPVAVATCDSVSVWCTNGRPHVPGPEIVSALRAFSFQNARSREEPVT